MTSQCLEMHKTEKVSILQLTKLIGLLSSTAQAVLPAQLQLRLLQQIQVESLSRDPSYQHQVTLNSSMKEELLWWVQNLKLQWKMSCTTPSTNGDSNGCFQNRLGSILPGTNYTGSMVQAGEVSSRKCVRTSHLESQLPQYTSQAN